MVCNTLNTMWSKNIDVNFSLSFSLDVKYDTIFRTVKKQKGKTQIANDLTSIRGHFQRCINEDMLALVPMNTKNIYLKGSVCVLEIIRIFKCLFKWLCQTHNSVVIVIVYLPKAIAYRLIYRKGGILFQRPDEFTLTFGFNEYICWSGYISV